eukprot:390476-Prorocentrum_minimum.AAC.1
MRDSSLGCGIHHRDAEFTIGMQDASGAPLSTAIEANTCLLQLHVAANKLISCWPKVAAALCVNIYLETLDVGGNGAAGALCMVKMLAANKALRTVNFSGCVPSTSLGKPGKRSRGSQGVV